MQWEWAFLPGEGWPCCCWAGEVTGCLSVRSRTEGNFTAATGVASNVINLNAGEECLTALGIKAKQHTEQWRQILSEKCVVCVRYPHWQQESVCARVFNSWNTFYFCSTPVFVCFNLLSCLTVRTTILPKSGTLEKSSLSRWTTSQLWQETTNAGEVTEQPSVFLGIVRNPSSHCRRKSMFLETCRLSPKREVALPNFSPCFLK